MLREFCLTKIGSKFMTTYSNLTKHVLVVVCIGIIGCTFGKLFHTHLLLMQSFLLTMLLKLPSLTQLLLKSQEKINLRLVLSLHLMCRITQLHLHLIQLILYRLTLLQKRVLLCRNTVLL